MAGSFLETDPFVPMTEDEVTNFEQEMLPQNTAKRADSVSLTETVKEMARDFGHLFEK